MTSLIQPIGPIMPLSPDRLSEFDAGVVLTTMPRLACLFLFFLLVYKITNVIVSKTPGFQKESKTIPIYHCISILLVSSLLIAFGWSMELLKGIIFLQILLYASASDKEGKFAFVCSSALVLFAVGAVVAVLINNVFLIPALSVAFAMIPFVYVRNILTLYEKQTKEELETTLSIITTSYSRDNNIVKAVEENLPYIKPPLKKRFTAFVGDAMAVSSSMKQALYNLKHKVYDEIFREWCDTLIQCQDNQEMKDPLQPVVSKLTDVRIVNSELNTMMSAVRTEYYTMVGLVVGNIPLLYVLNKDWFHTLIFETPGKIVLGICGIVIVVTYFFTLKFTKPVEYKR